MTIPCLLSGVETFINKEVNKYRIVNDANKMVNLNVFKGVMPQVKNNKQDDYPFILIQAGPGEAGEFESNADIFVLIGTNSKDDDAYLDCINILEHLRSRFIAEGIIGKRYELKKPVKWDYSLKDQWPKQFGILELRFGITQIHQVIEGEDIYD